MRAWNFTKSYRNFNRRRKSWGSWRALHWLLMHSLAKYLGFHSHFVLVTTELPRDIAPPEVAEGYETRPVGLNDLLPFAGNVPDLSREFLEQAFARGDECVANFWGQDLVGFRFQSRTRAPATNQLDVLVPKKFRYGYKAWVHPEHRRRNLSVMQIYVMNALPRAFTEREIGYIETHNYPALLFGYRAPESRSLMLGRIGWFTLVGRQIPFRTPYAKWVGLEFVRKDDAGVRQYDPRGRSVAPKP